MRKGLAAASRQGKASYRRYPVIRKGPGKPLAAAVVEGIVGVGVFGVRNRRWVHADR